METNGLPAIALDARLVCGTSTGDSTYWTGLLHGLARIEPEARFLLFTNAASPPEIPVAENFQWVCRPARSPRWWSYVLFPTLARQMGASVVHTQYALSPLVRRGGITTVHDVSFLIGPEWFRRRDRMLLQRTVPAAIRRAYRVIAVSETCRGEIERFVPAAKGKTEVTYNACPPWVARRPPEEARARLRKGFGLEGPYLLTVGTRWPRKNMELAVAAAELLPSELPHRLVVTGKAGWGGQEPGSRGLAVGYVSNETLCDLYSAADLYLAPSRHEGFGIPLLEAFRCGCPVICSEGGAMPEVAGDAAAVMSDWTPEGWARRIGELLSDSSNLDHLRRRGYEREKQFCWESTARKTFEIYMGALG
ncbi:MAG TPA: glycosyltransferase family 1 protein [Fimbriimonas sp.]